MSDTHDPTLARVLRVVHLLQVVDDDSEHDAKGQERLMLELAELRALPIEEVVQAYLQISEQLDAQARAAKKQRDRAAAHAKRCEKGRDMAKSVVHDMLIAHERNTGEALVTTTSGPVRLRSTGRPSLTSWPEDSDRWPLAFTRAKTSIALDKRALAADLHERQQRGEELPEGYAIEIPRHVFLGG